MNLQQYIIEQLNNTNILAINEGGASGHMYYPHNYLELTFQDLINIVTNLLDGKITNITEKVDGMNIQATKNKNGEVVFIRNKGDLNSERGGMLKSDMINKWSDKPHVLDTFSKAASTIEKVFTGLPISFFNKDNQRRYVNCECVIAGTTNIMPYASNQVDFHDIWIYEYDGKEWIKIGVTKNGLDKIDKACKNTDARLTPNVIIDTQKVSNELKKKYTEELIRICNDDPDLTIKSYLRTKFDEYIKNNYIWIKEAPESYNYIDILFKRFFLDDKTFNIRQFKNIFTNHDQELDQLVKKEYKKIVEEITKPLDDFFFKFGNDIVKLCKGIINQGREDEVVKELTSNLQSAINDIKKSGSLESQEKLNKQLQKLTLINNEINPAEGIVFIYNNKVMKLTSGFGPLNQIIGINKFNK